MAGFARYIFKSRATSLPFLLNDGKQNLIRIFDTCQPPLPKPETVNFS